MIDFRKAALLEAVLQLPYTFVMPNILFHDEWLCLSETEKQGLLNQGLELRDLPGQLVERSAKYFNEHKRLKLNDCFALVLAEETDGCILLTGDGALRRVAESNGIEARGVLWTIDQLETHRVVSHRTLHDALQLFLHDNLVFLPTDEILRRIRRLARMLK